MRVLVFGDSITQGYWDTEGGWVDRLRRHYDEVQVTDLEGRNEPTIFNLGISADNSGNILARIEGESRARTYHNKPPIVVVQIGINDSSIDQSNSTDTVSLPIRVYEQNLRAIIAKSKSMGSSLVFVGLSACDESKTTPVSWGEFHYTNEAIKRYEDMMKKVASDNDIPFIPVYDNFVNEIQKGKELLPDGLHPNNEGHEVMLNIILPQLVPYLAE